MSKKMRNAKHENMISHGNLKTNLQRLAESLHHIAESLTEGGRPMEAWELDLSIMASKRALTDMMADMPDGPNEYNDEFFHNMHATIEDLAILINEK